MSSSIFKEGMPEGLVAPMFDEGYAIEQDLVDPVFASALFNELKDNGKYRAGQAPAGVGPGVMHDSEIVSRLDRMPLLEEYWRAVDTAITEVSGFRLPDRPHLTYLTVRACPVEQMSSQIHRNDSVAGPWLVALVLAGSGSFSIYPNHVIDYGQEIPLRGDGSDPQPLATSEMSIGDSWGIYSREWSAPHAGGRNTSLNPKVIMLLYGWSVLDRYPRRSPKK